MIKKYVKNDVVVGLGSGELVNHAIVALGEALASNRFQGVAAVPACDAAANEAAFHGIPLTTMEEADKIDLAFEEADQIDISK